MDIKEYIQSGIIEQYVLGLADAGESVELEQLRTEYPELNEAILNFEKNYQEYTLANAVQPPSHIKSLIEQELFGNTSKAIVVEPSFINKPAAGNIGLWKWLAAACIILLATSTALNFYFYSGYKKSKEQYQALLVERNTLQANNASYQQSLQLFQDTAMVRVEMKGTPGKEQNIATVLWDQKSKDVYIYANSLQQAPAGKQYQLWAIVDGKPVSAGVINNCIGLCKMIKIDNAQAFAITLEKEGGSATPTLSEMYVIGKV
jgi:anti-sigma-K factor RskA